MKISHAIEIERPSENVFPWLEDPAKAVVWMSGVSKTEILHRTPELVGTTFREIVADESGSTDLVGVVTDFSPNRLIAFHLEGQFNDVDVEYRLDEANRGTRLSMQSDIRFKGALRLLSMLMWPLFKSKVLGQFRKDCERLKRLCEDGISDKAPGGRVR